MKQIDKDIILAYADCNMNQKKVTQRVYMSYNGIHYRLKKIKVETGLDPQKFYDLIKLVEMVKEDGGHEQNGN